MYTHGERRKREQSAEDILLPLPSQLAPVFPAALGLPYKGWDAYHAACMWENKSIRKTAEDIGDFTRGVLHCQSGQWGLEAPLECRTTG